jgi:hypothetical protein
MPYQNLTIRRNTFSTMSILRDICDHDFQRRTCDGVAERLDPGYLTAAALWLFGRSVRLFLG